MLKTVLVWQLVLVFPVISHLRLLLIFHLGTDFLLVIVNLYILVVNELVNRKCNCK